MVGQFGTVNVLYTANRCCCKLLPRLRKHLQGSCVGDDVDHDMMNDDCKNDADCGGVVVLLTGPPS